MSLKIINKNFSKISILTVFVWMQLISNGSAIKCFVCDSSDNPSCADLKSNSSIVAEECTLDKIKSIDTWLFDLNKFAYFNTGLHKNPLMNCQKVIARDPNTSKMVTARFCQLDTGDTDACDMLRKKVLPTKDNQNAKNNANNNNNYNSNNNNNNNGRRMMQQQNEAEEQFQCSICVTDNCNGATSRHGTLAMILVGGGSLLMTLMIVPGQQMILRLW